MAELFVRSHAIAYLCIDKEKKYNDLVMIIIITEENKSVYLNLKRKFIKL
jgi:hypothetical protein